jgi:hypothetical protein
VTGRRKKFKSSPPTSLSDTAIASGDDIYVVDIVDDVEGTERVKFNRWLGRGIDAWVLALAQQLRTFLASNAVTAQTVSAFNRAGVVHFLEFLVATGATYPPDRLNRERVEQFIEWLKINARGRKEASLRAIYSNVKSVLKGLVRRGLIPRQVTLFPDRQFRSAANNRDSKAPLTQGERVRLAEALRTDVIALHRRPEELIDSDALTVYALSLALRTGLNTTPLLGLRRDAMSRHPILPKMGLLRSVKRRNHSTQLTTLGAEPRLKSVTVPMDGIALFNQVLERTRPLAESAPTHLRNVVWIYRSAHGRERLNRLTTRTLLDRIDAFVRRHKLLSDDGQPLRLNNRRLRVTMENRLWKLANGDLFTVAQVMGHTPKVADQSYLAVTTEMRAHATIVGEALPDLFRNDRIPDGPEQRLEKTPVGSCRDSLFGEKAPKDGANHCMDFLSCFRCRSYTLVGSRKDLHRLFSFYWFIAGERTRIASREWREYFAYLMSLIDAFTLDKFDHALVADTKMWAKKEPLRFWRNYQMPYTGATPDA